MVLDDWYMQMVSYVANNRCVWLDRVHLVQIRELAIGKRSKFYQKAELFAVSKELCCAINNVDEVEVRFDYVCRRLRESDNITAGSALEEQSSKIFDTTKTALGVIRGDLMHFLALGLQPRICSDLQYMMYVVVHMDTQY